MSRDAQIGSAGVLLTQFYLLKEGVESAPMTTDSGVDLVAYWGGKAVTIQVKTAEDYTPAGGKGKPSVAKRIHKSKKVDYVSLAILSERKIWFLSWDEVTGMAYQHHPSGNFQFGFYKDPNVRVNTQKKLPQNWYRFENEHGVALMKQDLEGRHR